MNTQESGNVEEEYEASDMILDTQKEAGNSQNENDMISDSPMETGTSHNFENGGGSAFCSRSVSIRRKGII